MKTNGHVQLPLVEVRKRVLKQYPNARLVRQVLEHAGYGYIVVTGNRQLTSRPFHTHDLAWRDAACNVRDENRRNATASWFASPR